MEGGCKGVNWTPGLPSSVSATRRPVSRLTVREAAAARRGKFRPELHQGRPAELVSDPSGDFAPGLPLSLQEIAYGLRFGVWSTGTVFRLKEQLLVAQADGWVYTPGGVRVILVSSIGR